ncbi:MAG: hypothetical protein KatS3mg125_0190 [Lysobacterales bacterium]|jgi:uncharacterized protein YciI|nr:MAG: hypothetical protein KatS3mg125_0190 [Xanthomonadales bacterium]
MREKHCFLAFCRDAPQALEKRRFLLAEHLDWVLRVHGRFRVGGPLMDDAGDFAGSVLVVEAESFDEAEALLREDPYHRGGVWRERSLYRFVPAAGTWVGGGVLAERLKSSA